MIVGREERGKQSRQEFGGIGGWLSAPFGGSRGAEEKREGKDRPSKKNLGNKERAERREMKGIKKRKKVAASTKPKGKGRG